MTDDLQLTTTFTDYACSRLEDCLLQIERCLNLLTLEQIWHRPNDVSNSIGNLVLHLTGNVRQWVVGALGGEDVRRNRPGEFAQRDALPTGHIQSELRETVERARNIISGLLPNDLAQNFDIQGYHVNGLTVVFHVVEHFSLHTGQIVYATKLLINQDLSLYDGEGHRVDDRDSGTP